MAHAYVPPAPVAGNRVMLYGQNAIFQENFVSWGGDNADLAVDHAKWLMGGASAGTIWVSDIDVDLSVWWPGATATDNVGATVRAALSAAGFTISASSDDEAKITYPAFDIAIVGDTSTFATDYTVTQKADMLYDFVMAGGALMVIASNADYVNNDFISKDPINLTHSGPNANPGDENANLTSANSQNPTLFPGGRRFHRKLSNYVGVDTIDADSDHQEYAVDGWSDPHFQFATYSGHGDA